MQFLVLLVDFVHHDQVEVLVLVGFLEGVLMNDFLHEVPDFLLDVLSGNNSYINVDADGLVEERVELVPAQQHVQAVLDLNLALLERRLALVDKINHFG